MGAIVLCFQLNANFPSWTSRVRSSSPALNFQERSAFKKIRLPQTSGILRWLETSHHTWRRRDHQDASSLGGRLGSFPIHSGLPASAFQSHSPSPNPFKNTLQLFPNSSGLKQPERRNGNRRSPGSFRAMRPGNCGNLGNVGNVESVTCRRYYPGDETNPPLSAPVVSIRYGPC